MYDKQITCALLSYSLSYMCRAAFDAEGAALVSRANLEMLCLTWNVNEQRPEGSPLFNWIADLSAGASIAVVALQEIEMGGGSVAIAAAKDVLNKSAQVHFHLATLLTRVLLSLNTLFLRHCCHD